MGCRHETKLWKPEELAQGEYTFPDSKNHAPTILLDLDGTFADFETPFLQFAEAFMGKPIERTISHWLEKSAVTAYGQAGADKLMTEFYQSQRCFRSLPVYPGSAEFTRFASTLGYHLVYVTCRPVWRFENLRADTMYWLANNGFAFDRLVFVKAKSGIAREYVQERGIPPSHILPLAIDDNPDLIRQLSPYCHSVFVPYRDYNSEELPQNAYWFNNFEELKPILAEYATGRI